jgi:hypothetical protein
MLYTESVCGSHAIYLKAYPEHTFRITDRATVWKEWQCIGQDRRPTKVQLLGKVNVK